MKIIQWFIRLLPGSKLNPRKHEPPVPDSVTKPPPKSSPKPEHEHVLVANDDSPPGYKIRWCH